MAAARERFSIRDYTARMRIAVGPGKCWPFAGRGDENPPLPLISVRRYRWWVDELDDLKSSADFRQEIPVASCKGGHEGKEAENAKASPELPESPIKRSVVEELPSPKGRHRTPKKIRSMAELFASPSQIERALDQSDGHNDEERVKEKTAMVLNEEKKVVGKRKRKREGKKEGFKLKKKKICDPKMMPSAHIRMLQGSIDKKNLLNNAKGGVRSKKKSVEVKKLLKKVLVRGILKKKKGFTSTRKSKKRNDAKKAIVIKNNRRSTRHDTFSGKNDILGRSSKSSRIDHPQFKSLCRIFSEVLATSSALNNSSTGHELPPPADSDEVVNPCEKDTNVMAIVDTRDGCPSEKNQLSDPHNIISHLTIEKSSNSTVKRVLMVDLNHAVETSNDFDSDNPSRKNLSPSCNNSGDEDFRGTTHKNGSNTSTGIHQEAGLPKTSTYTPTEINFELNPSPHSSTSCVIVCNEVNERQHQRYFDADFMNLLCHMPENQPVCHCFISLPLNSQGEHVQTRPDMRFAQPNKNLNNVPGSSLVFSIMSDKVFDAGPQQNVQSRWYLNHHHPANVHKELNFTEITGSERLNIRDDGLIKDNNGFLHLDSNKTLCSLQDYASPDFSRKGDPLGKCNLDYQLEPIVQQTIRLMGKDVVIGGRNRDCDAYGRSWSNKDCRTGNNLPNHWNQPELIANTSCGSSTCDLLKLSDSPLNFYLMTEREPRFDLNIEHGLRRLSINTDKSIGNNVSGEAASGTGQHYPTIAYYQKNIDKMMSSSTNSKHTFATYQPQIQYHDHRGPEPSPAQPPEKLPQWLLNAKYSENPAFAPNSSQSSSTSAVTVANSNSEVMINIGIKEDGLYRSHTNISDFRSPIEDQIFRNRPPGRDDGFMNPAAKRLYFE